MNEFLNKSVGGTSRRNLLLKAGMLEEFTLMNDMDKNERSARGQAAKEARNSRKYQESSFRCVP